MSGAGQLAPLLWWLLGGVIFPVWLLSGAADYFLHARTDIAHTAGAHESALHLLQTAEIGIPLVAFLFFEVGAGILLLMVAGVVSHSISSWCDLRYAAPLRCIPPAEQFAHSFLNVLPWIALALVCVLHWPAVRSLFDATAAREWIPRLRDPAFDGRIIAAVLAASFLFGVLPGALEFAGTLAARRRGQTSSSKARSATNPR